MKRELLSQILYFLELLRQVFTEAAIISDFVQFHLLRVKVSLGFGVFNRSSGCQLTKYKDYTAQTLQTVAARYFLVMGSVHIS